MLDLKLLNQAVTLARHRNYARAAEALCLSQPALSRSIARLEAALGEKLFDRTRQGVEPTAFGQLLLTRGAALLQGMTELEREFELMRGLETGELRVGAGAYPAALSVGKAAGRLAGRYPGLRIEMTVIDLRAIIDAVLAARLDLAVVELSLVGGEPRLATESLPEHPGLFFCRAGHPLAADTQPTLEKILQFPYVGTRMPPRVGRSFYRLAKVGAIDPDTGDYLPVIKADTIQALKDVVRESEAVGAAPRSLLVREIEAGELVALPVRLPWLRTAYGFVHLRDRALSPAAQAFMVEVRNVEAELSAREA